jgi:hypothetical protein
VSVPVAKNRAIFGLYRAQNGAIWLKNIEIFLTKEGVFEGLEAF